MAFACTSSADQGKKKTKNTAKVTFNSKSNMMSYICVRIFSYKRQGLQLWNYYV